MFAARGRSAQRGAVPRGELEPPEVSVKPRTLLGFLAATMITGAMIGCPSYELRAGTGGGTSSSSGGPQSGSGGGDTTDGGKGGGGHGGGGHGGGGHGGEGTGGESTASGGSGGGIDLDGGSDGGGGTGGAEPLPCNGECAPEACCDNVCKDLQSDEDNCGKCGNKCSLVLCNRGFCLL
jgi:hypothetical protein